MISEQLRMVFVTLVSTIISFYTPAKGFLLCLTVCFAFNIWCGMRADGVSIKRCKNFNMTKFSKALCELFLYIGIVCVLFTCLRSMGDLATALACVKIITYVFMYVYLQNSFKNLIQAYPDNMAFADYRRSLPTLDTKCLFVDETINDPDCDTTAVLACYRAKMDVCGKPIHWERFI